SSDLYFFFFFFIIPLPPRSTLFPYTTLFRSIFEDFVQIVGVSLAGLDPLSPSHLANEMRLGREVMTADVPTIASRVQVLDGLLRSEEHTSELQSPCNLVCRLLLEKKKIINSE